MNIRPQAKIDNFTFKNSNIIIEGLIWKREDDLSGKEFEMQINNVFKKFLFLPNFFPYCFIQNFTKWCDSNRSRIIFQEKESS